MQLMEFSSRPQRRGGVVKRAPGNRGTQPLTQPRRGVTLVAGGKAPGTGALSPPTPLPASGERGAEGGVRGLVRGFHPSADGLLMLLPCGERPTAKPDLLLPCIDTD
jgi:hypothetical protein